MLPEGVLSSRTWRARHDDGREAVATGKGTKRSIEQAAAQALLDQIEHVDDAPGAAVAIVERVDALELMVNQCHFDQWVGRKQLAVVNESL